MLPATTTHPRLIRHPDGFGEGQTPVTRIGEAEGDTGIELSILRLPTGRRQPISPEHETALLLLDGSVRLRFDGQQVVARRRSLFDEDPTALHVPAGVEVEVEARSPCELVLLRTPNEARFEPRLFDADSMLESEHRGQGRLDDTAYRIVRTIFDLRNRPEARLVLGEVITFPGRWSSYPPHHHAQPEIYHYRFTEPQGYGHGELGDEVLKLRQYDTVKILDQRDHPQVAAPGYGMYYLWTIRHLPDDPYRGFEFSAEHDWLNGETPEVWRPGAGGGER